MKTYDPDNAQRDAAHAKHVEAFMRDDLAIAPPLTEDELRDLQARFDADYLRPVFDRKAEPMPLWVVPAVLISCLLVYLGVALALEAWLFS